MRQAAKFKLVYLRSRRVNLDVHLHVPALGEVPVGLMAVSALVVSYTVSLFREITAKPATSTGENRTATEDSIPFSFRIVCGFGAYGL